MSLDDARMNFDTLIDSYIAKLSPKGTWFLKEKGTGKTLSLKLFSKDLKSVKPASQGGGFYTGQATLLDKASGARIHVQFLVDFSGQQWTVKRMRILKRTSSPARKSQKAESSTQPSTPAQSHPE